VCYANALTSHIVGANPTHDSSEVCKLSSFSAYLSLSDMQGKSPVFIDPKCDLQTCARRILLGKCVNAGQTCVAPDYVLVPRDFQETLVQALTDACVLRFVLASSCTNKMSPRYAKFYPSSAPPTSPGTYSRLVTPEAFTRVSNLLKNTKGTIVLGGDTDTSMKYIAPTVVKDVKWDDSLMSE
jgi:aldehyde dehydrogenase (NAD+)